ncbi:hypothetical protein BaRGS_00016228 [Batillaria attramentaria]|uniref:HAUS augmin-like complex subunit 6 N-terminal domain-containing protein n=1 Tax=Batillaria attramentaria TaxID=370345 RepID=A0ABD0KZH1_9CAEN
MPSGDCSYKWFNHPQTYQTSVVLILRLPKHDIREFDVGGLFQPVCAASLETVTGHYSGMDSSSLRSARPLGDDQSDAQLGLDLRQIFFTNLQLLGFDAAAMEMKYRIPFNRDMFNLPNKAGSEAVLYFLFNRLNPTLCRQEFRDCWPVTDKKTEATFRKVCCMWLQNIQKEEVDARLPKINASLFLSPGGDKFCQLVFCFSSYVLLHVIKFEIGVKREQLLHVRSLTPQNKDLGPAMEKTVQCAAINHRRRFMEQLGIMTTARKCWQEYADELAKESRKLTKDIGDLEREIRLEAQKAATKSAERGSPLPSARHGIVDLSVNAARRAGKLQQVRDMWSAVDTFMAKTEEEREIISSIVDGTLESCVLDARDITVTIPHVMLVECEREIRRRQVENVHEAGKLNLLSVLQLGNLALRLIMNKIQEAGGLPDMSDHAARAKSQAHTHHAYLSKATALMRKMNDVIPYKKKIITKLRRELRFKAPKAPSGLALVGPSPTVNFNENASGATPRGSLLQKTPEQENTPEAAAAIASQVQSSVRRTLMSQHDAFEAFGILPVVKNTGNKNNFNTNNSNTNAENQNSNTNNSTRDPAQPAQKSHQVLLHTSLPAPQKSHSGGRCSTLTEPPQQLRGFLTHKKHLVKELTMCWQTRLIVWAVMHGSEEEERDHLLDSDYLQSHFTAHKPPPEDNPQQSSLVGDFLRLHVTPQRGASSSVSVEHQRVPETQMGFPTGSETRTPHHIVREAWVAAEGERSWTQPGQFRTPAGSHAWSHEEEAEDVNLQDPVAALSEDAFAKHDLIHRSPLEQDIQRMWRDVLSESIEKREGPTGDERRTASSSSASPKDLTPRGTLTGSGRTAADSSRSPFARVTSPETAVSRFTTAETGAVSDDSSHTPTPSYVAVAVREQRMNRSTSHEGEERFSPGQTLTSDGFQFSTSFDEDVSLEGLSRQEGKSNWEERTSALYDDGGELVDSDFEPENQQGSDDPLSFDLAMDEIFLARTPPKSRTLFGDPPRTNNGSNSGMRTKFSRSAPSPSVPSSLTPQQPSKRARTEDVELNSLALSEYASGGISGKSLLKSQASVRGDNGQVSSPRASFRDNSNGSDTSGEPKPVGEGADQRGENNSIGDDIFTFGRSGLNFKSSPTRSTAPKKVTFSPDSASPRARADVQDDLLGDDDLLNNSDFSPMNDSFTPLRSGLFLQGKSPARPSQRQSQSFAGPTHSAGTSGLFEARGETLPQSDRTEEDISARLARLRKMAAEALKNCQESGADVSVDMEEDEGGVDGANAGDAEVDTTPQHVG